MGQRKSPETYRELLELLIEFLKEIEEETPDEVDTYLHEAGYDPDDVVDRLRKRMKKAIDSSPLNWRNKTEQIQIDRSRLGEFTGIVGGNIEQLMAEIKKLLSSSGASSLALHHRKQNLTDMSEADLAQLLGELKYQLSKRQDSNGEVEDV